ncbi:MAG: hypothetical protein OES47_00755 [Acidobacteriota bacterium]|nr:hypothetical protein [Acidobacteriota bacterium]
MSRHLPKIFHCFVWALAFGLCGPLAALTYISTADGPLADSAELIVRARLAGGEVTRRSGRVTTDYDATVLEVLKGHHGGSRLVVRVPGGVALERGFAVRIFGSPSFAGDRNALLFLRVNDDGTYRVLHFVQGAFHETVKGNRRYLERDLSEATEVIVKADGETTVRAAVDQSRDAEAFEAWLRDRASGLERPADYFVSEPNTGRRSSEKFTVLSGPNITIRWFRFDNGRTVRWHRQRDGQTVISGGGAAQFRRARKAWNKSGTPVRLVNAGLSDATGGFARLDGKNTILFRDFNNSIGDDFDCATGGVLAIGGLSDFSASPRSWKQLAPFQAIEAEIVMNDGLDCFLAGQPKIAAQIYTHELGHTLGLGHSCGDARSPDCASSELLANAVMRASLANVVGARLSDDDLTGIRLLYDPEFFAAPCETAAPGQNKFCRQCGPCGEGQGNCRNDSDCYGLLVCDRDSGAEYGFSSGTNVCVDKHP